MPLNYPVIYKTDDTKSDAIVQGAIAGCVADAEALWQPEKFDGVYATKGFGIKKLEKWDIVYSCAASCGPFSNSWVISIDTARTWQVIFSGTMSDHYIILTGVFNYDAAPDVEAIAIVAEGIEYFPINLQEMYGWDEATAYLSHPVVVRPDKKILIYAKAETAGRKKFGFLGYTVAKRGYLINRQSGT